MAVGDRESTLAELVTEDGGGYSLCELDRPIRLSADYVRRVAAVEDLPANQSGADKSWVEEARREWLEHYARAERQRE